MTAKEKAKELVEKYRYKTNMPQTCALICVDEILNDYKIFNEKHKSYKVPIFWQDVKTEIQNL